MSKIIEHLGKESAWYLGPFMRNGKRGYELVHQTSILKRCNVTPIVDKTPSAIEYFGVEEGIKVLEANVPKHGLSTLAVGIFYVCLGKEMEATNVFEEFAANHNLDLISNVIFEMGDELQSRLWSFHLPLSNTYEKTFKFPEDDFLASPSCLYRHAHTMDLEGSCKNCRLFWVCLNISKLL
ncbi:hypothetical protein F2Q69_00011043 [Brassica cretica]|uniref:Uncharacterized protein n=1 Tax=Brassica cretica TaxID=69181 RepID=A0A8S9R792_BRACR|nr:hypothetical protein F2Q69_00011043 [Brassica cretica]